MLVEWLFFKDIDLKNIKKIKKVEWFKHLPLWRTNMVPSFDYLGF
jgi:hypothetical protein